MATLPLLLSGCGGDARSNNPAAAGQTSHPHAADVWPEPQPTPPPPVGKQGEATFLLTLRDRLIAVGAKLDGAPITGLHTAGACAATMTTGQGATTFRWADIGDLAALEAGGVMTLSLVADGRPQPLTMPAGNDADGISGALGMLEMDCRPN